MELDNALFSERPETFQAVDIDLAGGEAFGMVNPQVPVTAEHQSIVTMELISVDDGTPFDGLDGHVKQAFGFNISDHINFNNAVSLQDTEDRDFSEGSPAALAFPSAPEVAFVNFHLALEEKFPVFRNGDDAVPDDIKSLQGCRVRKAKLFGCFSGRDIQFKELDCPQPIFVTDVKPVNPSSAEIGEGIPAPFTAVSFAKDPVYFSALAACTKNKAFFPTRFLEKESGPIFTADKGLKAV